jgi:hypothetical protein
MQSNTKRRRFWIRQAVLLCCMGGCNAVHTNDTAAVAGASGSAANGGSAGSLAGVGGSPTSSAGRGAVPAQCRVELSKSGCPATHDAAIAAIDCSQPAPRRYSLQTCESLRYVYESYIDVGQTCSYDFTGKLVSSSTCSKTVGGCNCFVGGELNTQPCQNSVTVDACEVDAGTP